MAFRQCFFFDTSEVTKIVLPKVLQNFKVLENCTCWPKELIQNSIFLFFSAYIQYRARRKGPLVEMGLELFTCCMETCRLIFFYKIWKIPGACMETFCRITMQLPLFQLKLETFPLFTTAITLFSRVSFSSKYLT